MLKNARRSLNLPVTDLMISPADDEPEPRGDTAEVRFADVFGNALLPQDSSDMGQFHVRTDPDIAVYSEF